MSHTCYRARQTSTKHSKMQRPSNLIILKPSAGLGFLAAILAQASLVFCHDARAGVDPASEVNTFSGTGISSARDFGKVNPGAVTPFGMLFWSPDPAEGEFYDYDKPVTRGFSLTHINGAGCPAYGEVPILPILGEISMGPSGRGSAPFAATFTHGGESAEPGFYAVRLDSGIRVQLAAATRSGIAQFDFPVGNEKRTLVADVSRNLARVYDADVRLDGQRLSGSVSSGGFCGFLKNRYRVFFAIEVDQAPVAAAAYDDSDFAPRRLRATGPHCGAYFSFAPAVTTVRLKAAVSFVSEGNAWDNLRAEIPGWDIEKTRSAARTAWNAALGRIQITGGSHEQRRVFYSSLYRALIHPSTFSDVNGQYIGFDNQVHDTGGRVQYANYSGWDIYRSQAQLIAMLFPRVASDMAQSLVVDAQQGGGIPIWPMANDETGCMVGDPGVAVLASYYAFGARDFDVKSALAAIIKGGMDPSTHIGQYPERPGLKDYLEKGYVPARPEVGGASITLEDTTADFAVSRFAEALGDKETARQFLIRSGNWRKLFDPETKHIRPRDEAGKFLPNFSPSTEEGFVEGNAGQYTWMVPYDLKGLIEALGGKEAANARLDDYFSQPGTWHGGPYFFIANEPSFGNPWIYNWTGRAWRAQEVIPKALTDLFHDTPGGLPGNDDLGATSSWAVFCALGMFPEIPGVGGLALSSPQFPRIKMRLGQKTLQINAPGAPEKLYAKRVALDGRPVTNFWIPWAEMARASRLDFTLAATPDKRPNETPPSFSSNGEGSESSRNIRKTIKTPSANGAN